MTFMITEKSISIHPSKAIPEIQPGASEGMKLIKDIQEEAAKLGRVGLPR
eukprot:UN02801